MDPSLIRQQEAFKKKALAQPIVEKRKQPKIENDSLSNAQARKKSKKLQRPTSGSSHNYEKSSYGTSSKFSVLAQIVNFMKVRHQDEDQFPLTIEEILEECKLDETLPISQKNWLLNEALMHNPKIQAIEDPGQEKKFVFKPKYNIRDKKSLLKLLDRHDQRGLGGIMIADVEESLPNAKKCLRQLGNKITFVTRPDKKQILFYNDKSCEFTVDEEFQKLWRSIPVDSLDETKIEEYLNQHGISSVQGEKVKPIQKRKRAGNRKRKFKTHNHHLNGVLEDYTENPK